MSKRWMESSLPSASVMTVISGARPSLELGPCIESKVPESLRTRLWGLGCRHEGAQLKHSGRKTVLL